MKKIPIPTFPQPRDVASEVADLEDKLAEFTRRIRALELERSEIALRIQAGQSDQAVTPEAARVAALLGNPGVTAGVTDRSRLGDIAIELHDLRAAIDVADGMRRMALSKASAIICAQVAPQYRDRVRAVADALRAANQAHCEMRAFTDGLEEQDIAWTSLGVLFPTMLGNPTDPNSPIASYFRELVTAGIVERREVPEGLA